MCQHQKKLRQVREFTAGKPYLLQCVFGSCRHRLLTQVWRTTGAFAYLPKSLVDAQAHFAALEGTSQQKDFWWQFTDAGRSPLLNDQLKQLMELHQMAEPALQDLCIRLWPTEPLPSSYFGRLQWQVDAPPRIDAWKRSTYIEGARLAFAMAKVQVPALKSAAAVTGGPPKAKNTGLPTSI